MKISPQALFLLHNIMILLAIQTKSPGDYHPWATDLLTQVH